MPKLTEKLIASITTPKHRELFCWDSELKGFGLRVMPSGRKVFVVQYRNAGRSKRYKIGVHGRVKAEQARSTARELLGRIETGADPSADRAKLRQAPTMHDLARDYLERHGPKKRTSSLRKDRSMLERIILPRLGQKRVTEVTRRDLETLHLSLITTPYQANRVAALTSKMLSLAIRWDWRSDNPARGIERFPEQPRERWLSNEELARLSEALMRYPAHSAANAIRLLILTGARRGEVLEAKWEEFDLSRGVWTKPSHHTKQQRREHSPLSSGATAILAQMRAADLQGTHLFPGDSPDRPLQDIKRFWKRILTEAGIPHARLHDLRHTYASHLVSSGLGLPIVGRLLGHTQVATTQRYAHLADDPVRAATERFARKINGLQRHAIASISRLGRK
jgi:integrase